MEDELVRRSSRGVLPVLLDGPGDRAGRPEDGGEPDGARPHRPDGARSEVPRNGGSKAVQGVGPEHDHQVVQVLLKDFQKAQSQGGLDYDLL